MNEWVQSPFFGIVLTVFAYWIGVTIQKKTKLAICNSILIAMLVIWAVLTAFRIPFASYHIGGDFIHLMLGPATTCMAVSIYNKRELLKKNLIPVLAGCFAGVLTSFASIMLMGRLFGLDDTMLISLVPKSVTTPIATAISQDYGGVMSITVAAVIVTGTMGNLTAPFLVKLFRIKDPMAAGLGIGACSHAVGTAKAIEMGETEGALSGLAIGICGIMTAIWALTFGWFF
jgi:putative effector of murein hydrolase